MPESDTMLKLFRALGANPVSHALDANLHVGKKERGVIDGLEGVPEVPLGFKICEVGNYVAKTGHILATLQLLVGDTRYAEGPAAGYPESHRRGGTRSLG